MIVGAGIATAFQVGKAPPVLPMLRTELNMSLFLAGWVLSAFNILGAFSSAATGAAADWYGHRRMILTALISQAAACFVGSFAESPGLLLATRFVEGFGYIAVAVSAPSLIIRLTAFQDRRVAFGVWGTFMPAGGAMMMMIAPFVAEQVGWRGLWRLNTVLLVVFVVLMAWATPSLRPLKKSGRFSAAKMLRDMWTVLKAPGPRLMALCFMTFAMQFLSVMGFLPTMLIEVQGFSPRSAAILTAIGLAMNVPGNLLGGILLQRGVRRWKLIAAASLAMGITGLGIYVEGISFIAQYTLVLSFFLFGGLLPVSVIEGATATSPSPAMIGTSNGILMQGGQVGLLIGPPSVAAFVTHFGGWSSAAWLLAIFAGLGVLVAWKVKVVEERY